MWEGKGQAVPRLSFTLGNEVEDEAAARLHETSWRSPPPPLGLGISCDETAANHAADDGPSCGSGGVATQLLPVESLRRNTLCQSPKLRRWTGCWAGWLVVNGLWVVGCGCGGRACADRYICKNSIIFWLWMQGTGFRWMKVTGVAVNIGQRLDDICPTKIPKKRRERGPILPCAAGAKKATVRLAGNGRIPRISARPVETSPTSWIVWTSGHFPDQGDSPATLPRVSAGLWCVVM